MKTPDSTSHKVAGDLGFRVVTPSSETLGAAAAIADAVPGDSAPFEVFSRIGDTYTWRTAPPGDFSVSWVFPKGATSATLLVEGVGYSQTYADLTATSQVLSLPAATEGSENVYDLTLAFNDGTVQTASLGRIRGAVAGNAATVRYAATNSAAWRVAGPVNVFAVLPGATSLEVDGGAAVPVVGAGYHAWRCSGRNEHALVLAVGESDTFEATLRQAGGTLVFVR